MNSKQSPTANAKMTYRQAAAVRRLYAAGGVSQTTLAARYGVSQVAISLIVRGKTYQEKVCKL